VDKDADIAILECDCSDIAFLLVQPDNTLAEGQTVLVIGNLLGSC
jgi:hypothetical protein